MRSILKPGQPNRRHDPPTRALALHAWYRLAIWLASDVTVVRSAWGVPLLRYSLPDISGDCEALLT